MMMFRSVLPTLVLPPGIHGDREVTIFKVEGTDITIVLEYDNDHF